MIPMGVGEEDGSKGEPPFGEGLQYQVWVVCRINQCSFLTLRLEEEIPLHLVVPEVALEGDDPLPGLLGKGIWKPLLVCDILERVLV
jgi:hypothetical protein